MFYCVSRKRIGDLFLQENLPYRKYVCCDRECWIAIDNSTGDRWTEVFKTCLGALVWLEDIDEELKKK